MLEYAFRSVGKQLHVLRFIQDVTQSGDLKNGEGSKKVGYGKFTNRKVHVYNGLDLAF